MNAQPLLRLLNELEENIGDHQQLQPAVSGASIGWHIEHCLLIIDAVTGALARSKPEAFQKKFNLKRSFLLWWGNIPRGKVKAPKVVQPSTIPTEDALTTHLQQARVIAEALPGREAKQFFTHPFLGDMRLQKTIRFLYVHTLHHVKIIRDIGKAASVSHQA